MTSRPSSTMAGANLHGLKIAQNWGPPPPLFESSLSGARSALLFLKFFPSLSAPANGPPRTPRKATKAIPLRKRVSWVSCFRGPRLPRQLECRVPIAPSNAESGSPYSLNQFELAVRRRDIESESQFLSVSSVCRLAERCGLVDTSR